MVDMHIYYLLAQYVRLASMIIKDKPQLLIDLEKSLRDAGFKLDD
jgi:hypothetical protein